MTHPELCLRRLDAQHLLQPTEQSAAARDLCGVQAQYMGHAFHALRLRSPETPPEALGQGLVKSWTLRGTAHLHRPDDLGLFVSPEDYRCRDWSRPSWWNRRPDWALSPGRQSFFSELILAALQDGPRSREELKDLCRRRGLTPEEEHSLFHPWGGGMRELCERGFTCYLAREEKRFCLAPEFTPLPPEEALQELLRRYFLHYGPATLRDAAHFFALPQAKLRPLLPMLPLARFEQDGRTYFYFERPRPSGELPACLFLAGFDPLMLGYEKDANPFLPVEYRRAIFLSSGIVQPALLLDGRVAGRWKKTGQKLQITLFAPGDPAVIESGARMLWPELKRIEYF